MEKTFIILKPDAVQRGLVGEILGRLERRGLKLAAMKFMQVSDELARKHYAVHAERPFFAGLIEYITKSPVVALVVEGTNAISVVRTMVGATRPHEAAPGTIRADFGLDVGRNLVHASDGPETAKDEIALWFGDDLVSWERANDSWIYE
ncbi:MAG: nucleoside-diphosphate kinase [Caldilineaceae bacterium]|nr:nucleoside-diphosphate kinase [Caldilineaceae bacterium]